MALKDSTRGTVIPHIAVRIQRGGGTGPTTPRQPSRASEKRWQFHQAPRRRPGRCCAGASSRTFAANPGGGSISLPADALKCKECSTTYPLDARYVCERCFGPLEVAYLAPPGTPDELK